MATDDADPEMVSESEVVITCSACLGLPAVTHGASLNEKLIDDWNTIEHWPHVVERADVIHALDRGSLIAQYRLRTSEVRCSLPDQTWHKRGWLAIPRCEAEREHPGVLRVGRCCAQLYVVGFKAAMLFEASMSQERKWLNFVRNDPRACLVAIGTLKAVIAKMNLHRPCSDDLRQAFTRLARASAREHEYTVEGKEFVGKGENMRVRKTEFVGRVEGLDFWKSHWSGYDVENLEGEARALRDLDLNGISSALLDHAHRRARSLRKKTTALARWVESGRAFFAPQNHEHAKRLALRRTA